VGFSRSTDLQGCWTRIVVVIQFPADDFTAIYSPYARVYVQLRLRRSLLVVSILITGLGPDSISLSRTETPAMPAGTFLSRIERCT